MLKGILGTLVWIVATVAYVSYVRDGERGFKRLAAFWLGFPWTLCCAFIVPRSKRLREPRRDELEDERTLLMEIRRDRALRIGRTQEGDEEVDQPVDGVRDEEA